DFTNRVCEKAFEKNDLTYEALEAKRDAHESETPVVRVDVDSPEAFAQWVLDEQERGVPLSDQVLLLRKIRGNEKWIQALSRAGIPVSVGSGGLFWEERRVRELVAFLRAWSSNENHLSWATFLRAPWVGVTDLEL